MGDIPLSTWANLAEIVGAGSLVSGLVFGWFQLRNYHDQQRNIVAINLAQTFYSRDFAQGVVLLQTLPDGISLRELREKGPEYELAAITIITSFETMGLLAFRRIAPMELVLDMAGGLVGVMCVKLRRLQNDLREEQQQPSWGEWFEWLGDQALKRKAEAEPAHIRYKNRTH